MGCHFLLQGIFLTPGIEPRSPALQANSLPTELPPLFPFYLFSVPIPCLPSFEGLPCVSPASRPSPIAQGGGASAQDNRFLEGFFSSSSYLCVLIPCAAAAAAAKSRQSCPTPCDPRDGSPPVSPIPGIFQAGVGCHKVPPTKLPARICSPTSKASAEKRKTSQVVYTVLRYSETEITSARAAPARPPSHRGRCPHCPPPSLHKEDNPSLWNLW